MLWSKRVATVVALLVSNVTAARADEARAIDISRVPFVARTMLAPATVVQLPTGENVTIATLLAAHAARQKRLAVTAVPSTAPASARMPIGPDHVYLGDDSAHVPTMQSPPPASRGRVALGLVEANARDRGLAAAYVDFCSRAAATVCLYEPGPAVYALNVPSTGTMSEIDPFLDGGGCTAAGGSMQRALCYFSYPMSATARFDPGVPPVAEREGTCAAEFIGKIEPKGIVTIAFDPKSFETDSHENARFATSRSCVIRIFAPAR